MHTKIEVFWIWKRMSPSIFVVKTMSQINNVWSHRVDRSPGELWSVLTLTAINLLHSFEKLESAFAPCKAFLRASAMLKHVIDIGWTSVRLSVSLSVRPSHAGTVSKRLNIIIVMLSSPHDSPFILVLCISRSSQNSNGVTPCGAAKQRWGLKISQFSTNNSISQKWLKIEWWVHVARRLTSIESSFQPCDILQRLSQGRTQRKAKCG